ncbi:Signal recognition particle receptor subunit beta [Pseudolycoriella hygida]|uniref:Signal recognition particle receptor subunit beta n=1 Tax=Pseudolycoriella hygida TaxID=35572 RepID=A0A9Q0N2P3_9DIPT|nr:Signal recognition particle receptor subunit beta [Pseudolycoriella hygida]
MDRPDNSGLPDNIVMGEVDYSNLPYIISLFVLILSLLILFLWRKTKTARTDLLVVGPSDSGKTYLYSQLLYSEDKETFTSIAANTGIYNGEHGQIKFVDIPGNERLRGKFLDQYKYLAKGVIYVVDSLTLQRDIRDVADYLYTILADSAFSATPILILCNKQDETMAKGSGVIQNLLEKELNLIRTTRSNRLQSVDNSTNREEVYLGKQGKDFSFSHLAQNIQFAECSAKDREFKSLIKWIESL